MLRCRSVLRDVPEDVGYDQTASQLGHRNSSCAASVDANVCSTLRCGCCLEALHRSAFPLTGIKRTANALQPCQLHAPPPASFSQPLACLARTDRRLPPIVPPASFAGPSASPLLPRTPPAAALRLVLALAAPAVRKAAIQLAHVLVFEPLLPALAGPVSELDLGAVGRTRAVSAVSTCAWRERKAPIASQPRSSSPPPEQVLVSNGDGVIPRRCTQWCLLCGCSMPN